MASILQEWTLVHSVCYVYVSGTHHCRKAVLTPSVLAFVLSKHCISCIVHIALRMRPDAFVFLVYHRHNVCSVDVFICNTFHGCFCYCGGLAILKHWKVRHGGPFYLSMVFVPDRELLHRYLRGFVPMKFCVNHFVLSFLLWGFGILVDPNSLSDIISKVSCCVVCYNPKMSFAKTCINPASLAKPLKTHVLDRWCSDRGRFVKQGPIRLTYHFEFYHRRNVCAVDVFVCNTFHGCFYYCGGSAILKHWKVRHGGSFYLSLVFVPDRELVHRYLRGFLPMKFCGNHFVLSFPLWGFGILVDPNSLSDIFSKVSCCVFCYDRKMSFAKICINPASLAKPLKTHVLDRWCSDRGRFVKQGLIRLMYHFEFYCHTLESGILPLLSLCGLDDMDRLKKSEYFIPRLIDMGWDHATHWCVRRCAWHDVSRHLHLSIGNSLDLACVLLFPCDIIALISRHHSDLMRTLKCNTPTTLTKTLKTHVLDLWCSDGCRLVSRGRISADDRNNSSCPSFYQQGFLMLGQCDVAGRDHTKGCRIGEAKNPGPDLIVTVSNPTSMNQKHSAYQQLPGHVHCVAETAMTQTLIDESAPLFRAAGFKCHWGAPVPSHRLNKCGLPTRRGASTGVAILTKDIHSKHCFDPMPNNWHSTCRIVECMIRVQSIDIKVISIYGVQSSAQNAKSNTNALLSAAMYRSQAFPGPCIVAGDFNFRPSELEAWETCRALGFVDLTEVAKHKFPHKVFPTCKDSTNHDTILVNHFLAERFVDFCVHIDKKFDVHAPLSVTFQLPVDGLYRSTWKLPADISNLGLEKCILHDTYNEIATEDVINQIVELSVHDPDEAYCQWASLFEKSVDLGLRQQKLCGAHMQHGCLRPFHKGRGRLPKIVREHVPISFRKGCENNYTPKSDASNVNLRQKTKQVRRLQALISRLTKWNLEYGDFHEAEISNDLQMASYLQINSEWWAIQQAKGFESGFLNWLADPDRLGFQFLRMPTKEGLKIIEGILKKECDRQTSEFQAFRKKVFKIRVNVDVLLFGGSFTYKLLRPASKPTLQTLTSQQSFTCELTRIVKKGLAQYKISPLHLIDVSQPLYCDNKILQPPLSFQNGLLTVSDLQGLEKPKFVATQQTWITDENSLHASVSCFWNQYWRRDSDDDDFNEIKFEKAIQIIQDALPSWDTIQVQISPECYQKRALSMKSTAARGCDGFTIGDIKMFSIQMWQHLSTLLQSCKLWPQVLTYCKTIMLPKKEVEGGPEATRPITIAAIVYRIWATVHAKAILVQWSGKLPPQVSGGIPQRGTLDLIFESAIDIEFSQFQSEPLAGFVLDLEKAFNALPRSCIFVALKRLGVPLWLITKWRSHLKQLTRCLVIGENIQLGCVSNTGVPEGDALSILAMTSLSFAWKCYIAHESINSYSYADNLEWNSHDHLIHRAILTKTLDFMNAMCVKVSPAKSWAWALDKKGSDEWKNLWADFFPDHDLCLAQDAVDLGVEMHYNKKRKHTIIPKRFENAIERAKKLEKIPVNCDVKSKMVLTSVIPTAIYGLELAFAGKIFFHKLRTSISKCFVGQYKSTNPWLVCALFGVKGVDPELHYLVRLVRFVRKYAIKHEADSHVFWHLVLLHDGNTNSVYGPAAVFAQACIRLGWIVKEPGVVQTHLGDTISLCYSDLRLIEHRIHDAWDSVVMNEISHKVNLREIGNFSLTKTRQLLSHLPCHQRILVVMQIAGSIQTIMSHDASINLELLKSASFVIPPIRSCIGFFAAQ